MKFLIPLLGLVGLVTAKSRSSAKVLDVLKGRNKNGLVCCNHISQPWIYIPTYTLLTSISALQTRGGKCIAKAQSCVQIACTDSAEVVLCNDNSYRTEPSCDYLASYAFDILAACKYHDTDKDDYRTCGQRGDGDGYTVVVKEAARDVGCPQVGM